MATISPYINFADRTREAFEFYKGVFGGDYEYQLVKQSPSAEQMPAEWAERVYHGAFTSGDINIMGSDVLSDQAGRVVGNVHSLVLECDDADEMRKFFDGLAEGGKVVWPIADSEWGSLYGQVTDKFGIQWMLNCTTSNS